MLSINKIEANVFDHVYIKSFIIKIKNIINLNKKYFIGKHEKYII